MENFISSPNTRVLIAIIADETTTTGFLLAGIGAVNGSSLNYMMVNKDTPSNEVETFFLELFNRKDVGVILIGKNVASSIAQTVTNARLAKSFPIVLEIPTGEKPLT